MSSIEEDKMEKVWIVFKRRRGNGIATKADPPDALCVYPSKERAVEEIERIFDGLCLSEDCWHGEDHYRFTEYDMMESIHYYIKPVDYNVKVDEIGGKNGM